MRSAIISTVLAVLSAQMYAPISSSAFLPCSPLHQSCITARTDRHTISGTYANRDLYPYDLEAAFFCTDLYELQQDLDIHIVH